METIKFVIAESAMTLALAATAYVLLMFRSKRHAKNRTAALLQFQAHLNEINPELLNPRLTH